MEKLLSIVIANYNYGRFLEDAIKSVLSQDVGDWVELIVCDGGSTDNSVEIIKKYAGGLPPGVEREVGVGDRCRVDGASSQLNNRTIKQSNNSLISYWVSEPDKGQSDAFNKGFSHAHGKYLTWLNADDLMVPGSLAKICRELMAHPNCEWFTGNMFRFAEDGRVLECPWGPHYLPKCLQTKHQPVAAYGPATFFTKDLFDRVGGMKVYQHFMMDTDLWMRFIVAGVKQRRINCFCWAFRMHTDSKTAEYGEHKLSFEQSQKFKVESERSTAETGYVGSSINRRFIQLWRILDGSFFKWMYLKMTFNQFPLENMHE